MFFHSDLCSFIIRKKFKHQAFQWARTRLTARIISLQSWLASVFAFPEILLMVQKLDNLVVIVRYLYLYRWGESTHFGRSDGMNASKNPCLPDAHEG